MNRFIFNILDRCPHNRFGMLCEYSCSQCIFGTCNWRLRICECHSGFTGIFCNQTLDNTRHRGVQTHRCQLCHKGNTASCHMEVGRLFYCIQKKEIPMAFGYILNRKLIFDLVWYEYKDRFYFTSSFRLASVNVCPVIVE